MERIFIDNIKLKLCNKNNFKTWAFRCVENSTADTVRIGVTISQKKVKRIQFIHIDLALELGGESSKFSIVVHTMYSSTCPKNVICLISWRHFIRPLIRRFYCLVYNISFKFANGVILLWIQLFESLD